MLNAYCNGYETNDIEKNIMIERQSVSNRFKLRVTLQYVLVAGSEALAINSRWYSVVFTLCMKSCPAKRPHGLMCLLLYH